MKKFEKYLNRENSPMPKEHVEILERGEELTADLVLQRTEINKLFNEGYLESESGFRRNEDGSVYVTVLTQMPKVSTEMLDWWFWWHAKEGVRYQIWYPDMHYDINADFQGHYEDESKTYRQRLHLSKHLVREDVGLGKDKILIDFMHPSDFGFDQVKLDVHRGTIICARVASPEKGVWGTEMCHFVRGTAEGVEMRSRFWIGNKIARMGGFGQKFINSILNKPFVKRKLIPNAITTAMFHHCSQEYHNLADILPELYKQEKLEQSSSK